MKLPGLGPILETKCKLLFLVGRCVLVLDVSYRDDLRMFFAWRAEVGTMSRHKADGSRGMLQPLPCKQMPDPWAAYCYDEVDNFLLKPWQAWGPPNLFQTNVRVFCAGPGLFARQHYGKCL